MDARTFFDEVAKLRELQKEYFKTRNSMALTASKKQEKLIDEEIKRVGAVIEKQQQRNLFNE